MKKAVSQDKHYVISESESRRIDMIKAMSIFSVICAHCNAVPQTSSAWNVTVHYFLNAIGTIGVGVFFAVSGYLLAKQPVISFSAFMVKKARRLVPAWIILGTMVYLYVAVRKWGVTPLGWLGFLLGRGSYLYFVPVLFCLYAAGYIVRYLKITGGGYSKTANLCMMAVSVMSNIMTYTGFFSETYAAANPCNWYVYFGIGMILADEAFQMPGWVYILCSIAASAVMIWVSFRHRWLNYWTPGFVLFELAAGISVNGTAKALLHAAGSSRLCGIGKQTLFLYLAHMPVAGIMANLCGRIDSWALTLLRPFFVLAVTWTGMLVYCNVIKHLHLSSIFMKSLGIQE